MQARHLGDESDWWGVRSLLVATTANSPPGWTWDIRHWDGWRFHNESPLTIDELRPLVGVLESEQGIVAAVHAEAAGVAFLEVRPDDRASEPGLLSWAEEHLAVIGPAGPELVVELMADGDREELLRKRGYRRLGDRGWARSAALTGAPMPAAPATAPGYVVRTTAADVADCRRMADLLNAAFRRTIHTAGEYRTFMRCSPSFDHALNLVAVAPDGSFAAHVGITFEPTARVAIIEPVATHPAHRQRGLAKGLILEGLARARRLGAERVSLDAADTPAANALYESCGFVTARHYQAWQWRASPAGP